jgi:hypothetical protein
LGVPNLHFHDLWHTGNTLAADMSVSLRNLMARLGHDNERAALQYQRRSAKADRAIADEYDALVQAVVERVTESNPLSAWEIKPIMPSRAADLADHGAASDRE